MEKLIYRLSGQQCKPSYITNIIGPLLMSVLCCPKGEFSDQCCDFNMLGIVAGGVV